MIETNKYYKKIKKDYDTLIYEKCTFNEFKEYNKEILFELGKITMSQNDYTLLCEVTHYLQDYYADKYKKILKIQLALNDLLDVLSSEFIKSNFKKVEKENKRQNVTFNFS